MSSHGEIKVRAAVKEQLNGEVKVSVMRPVECGDCGACLTGEENIVTVKTDEELTEGQEVWLKFECSAITKISFLLYFLPAFLALAGFTAGYYLAGNWGGFFGALIMLVMGYLGVRRFIASNFEHSVQVEK